jgi:predicted GNAT family N-acyltransferase
MPRKEQIDALAEKIRREIENLGACSLQNQELAVLWGHAEGSSKLENQMHLSNFSTQYGFVHRADDSFTTVSFRMLN